jgi:hypothetical protein
MNQMFSLTPESIPEMAQLTDAARNRMGSTGMLAERVMQSKNPMPKRIADEMNPEFAGFFGIPDMEYGKFPIPSDLMGVGGKDTFGNVTDGFPTDWDDAPPTNTQVPGQLPAGLSEEEFNRLFDQQQNQMTLSPFKAVGRFFDSLFSTDVSSGGNFSSGNVRTTVDAQRRQRYEEYRRRTQGN